MTDRIEKSIAIAAPVERVWRALTDHEEFGAWFRVKLEGPFVLGEVSRGRITYAGYEHLKWEARVVAMEAPRLFAFTWHPYAVDPDQDYSGRAADPGRVPARAGRRRHPPHRRRERLRRLAGGAPGRGAEVNTGGWEEQVSNVKAHVER